MTEVQTRPSEQARAADALGLTARPDTRTTAVYQSIADESRGTGGRSAADLLGFFSLGLGVAEVVAPGAMSRIAGVRKPNDTTRSAVRLMGLREIGHGVSILSSEYPAGQVSARVGGDMLDLALLGRTMAQPGNSRGRTLFATLNVLAVTALDVMTAKQLARQPKTPARERLEHGIVESAYAVTVNRPVEEVFAYWRDLQNLPNFMRHLESVTHTGDGRSHWVAKAPGGGTAEWDAEISEERPNELIAWRSIPGSGVQSSGEVRFLPAPNGMGTEVRLSLAYDPPMGKLGAKVALLFRQEPTQQAKEDLRHFKQVMETGQVLFSDASKRSGPHAAFPTDDAPRL